MQIACLDRAETAQIMADIAEYGAAEQPVYMTSANGQVLSEYASNPQIRALFDKADLISADGQPMVVLSRLLAKRPLPERCATTDLYHDVAKAARPGTRFFLLGATQQAVETAVANTRRLYPHINVIGYANGYFTPDEERTLVKRINLLEPDILWLAMGVPREQDFIVRNKAQLKQVKLIKTSGGLFDFLSGQKSRAPQWLQRAGLEWLYRLGLEPRRLLRRYAITNCHSLMLLLTSTR